MNILFSIFLGTWVSHEIYIMMVNKLKGVILSCLLSSNPDQGPVVHHENIEQLSPVTVILFQIVMVSPGTDFVKNHKSHSRTNESQLKKQRIWNWTCFELLHNQTVNLREERLQNSVLYSILKLKYSPSILRHNMYGTLNNSHSNCHRNCTNRIFLQKHMDQMINLCILWDACHELFCVLRDFYVSGTQDAEVTQSLSQFKF